jgi:hypothetical protein
MQTTWLKRGCMEVEFSVVEIQRRLFCAQVAPPCVRRRAETFIG